MSTYGPRVADIEFIEHDTPLKESLRGSIPRPQSNYEKPKVLRPKSDKGSPSRSRPISARPGRAASPQRTVGSNHNQDEQQTIAAVFAPGPARGIRSLPNHLRPEFRQAERSVIMDGVKAMEGDLAASRDARDAIIQAGAPPQEPITPAPPRVRSMIFRIGEDGNPVPIRRMSHKETHGDALSDSEDLGGDVGLPGIHSHLPQKSGRASPTAASKAAPQGDGAGAAPTPASPRRHVEINLTPSAPSPPPPDSAAPAAGSARGPAAGGGGRYGGGIASLDPHLRPALGSTMASTTGRGAGGAASPSSVVMPHSLATRDTWHPAGTSQHRNVLVGKGFDRPGNDSPESRSFGRFGHGYSNYDREKQIEFRRKESNKFKWMGGRNKSFVQRAVKAKPEHQPAFNPVRYLEDPYDFAELARRKDRAQSARKAQTVHRGAPMYVGKRNAIETPQLKSFLAQGLDVLSRDLAKLRPDHYVGIDVDSVGVIVVRFDPSGGVRRGKEKEEESPAPSPTAPSAPSAGTSSSTTGAPAAPAPAPRLPATGAITVSAEPPPASDAEPEAVVSNLKRFMNEIADNHLTVTEYQLKRDGLHWALTKGREEMAELLFAFVGPFSKRKMEIPEHLQRPTPTAARLPWAPASDLSARDRPEWLVKALKTVEESRRGVSPPPMDSPTFRKYRADAFLEHMSPTGGVTAGQSAADILAVQAAHTHHLTQENSEEHIHGTFLQGLAMMAVDRNLELASAGGQKNGGERAPGSAGAGGVPAKAPRGNMGSGGAAVRIAEGLGRAGSNRIMATGGSAGGHGAGDASPGHVARGGASPSPGVGPGTGGHIPHGINFIPFTQIPLSSVAEPGKRHIAVGRMPFAPFSTISYTRPSERSMRFGGAKHRADVPTARLLREAELETRNAGWGGGWAGPAAPLPAVTVTATGGAAGGIGGPGKAQAAGGTARRA